MRFGDPGQDNNFQVTIDGPQFLHNLLNLFDRDM